MTVGELCITRQTLCFHFVTDGNTRVLMLWNFAQILRHVVTNYMLLSADQTIRVGNVANTRRAVIFMTPKFGYQRVSCLGQLSGHNLSSWCD